MNLVPASPIERTAFWFNKKSIAVLGKSRFVCLLVDHVLDKKSDNHYIIYINTSYAFVSIHKMLAMSFIPIFVPPNTSIISSNEFARWFRFKMTRYM